ncbi:MAG: hypothetical protein JSR82_07535 [Verrucomicrobia bacterium]|nr:hypothetical protein [Verrucomicrobiota bacterium]
MNSSQNDLKPAPPLDLSPAASVPPAGAAEDATTEQMVQRKAILEDLTAGFTELGTAQKDAEVAALVTAAGFTTEEIGRGIDLLKAAAASVGVRYEDLGKARQRQGEFAEAREAARASYVKFRRKARIIFPTPAATEAMALRGTLPEDFDTFVSLALQSYAAGAKSPWTEKLARRGYPAERLSALTAELNTLLDKKTAQRSAQGDAQKATALRNDAYASYREFIVEFRGLVRIEMEGRPGAKTKMNW